MAAEVFDQLEVYCRRLGHEVSFIYCRTQGEARPCHHILNCWHERIPIKQYARTHFTEEELQAILAPPPPKIVSLWEQIEKAKRRTGQ